MTLWAKSIKSNLKRGVDIELPGPKTIIVGPKGVGKSSIVQAIELATTKSASDVLGRRVIKTGVDLLTLAPGRTGPLHSTVEFSDGSSSQFFLQGSTAKSTGLRFEPPRWLVGLENDAFPLRNVMEALLGSADKTRKFFLSRVGELSVEKILTSLGSGSGLLELWQEATVATPPDASAKLLKAIEYAAKKARDEKAKGEAKREAAHEVGTSLAAPYDDLQVAEKEDEIRQARELLAERQKSELEYSRLQRLISSLDSDVLDWNNHVIDLDKQIFTISRQIQEARTAASGLDYDGETVELLDAVLTIANWMQDSGEPCPITGVRLSGEDLQEFIGSAIAQREVVEAANADASHLEFKLQSLGEELTKMKQIRQARYSELMAKKEELVQAKQEYAAVASALTETDGLEDLLKEAEADLLDMKATQSQWNAMQAVAANAVDSDIEAAKWKKFHEALQKIAKKFLNDSLSSFVEDVSQYLPANEKLFLRLQDGNREVCQYGLLRDGELISALSGGEWGEVTLALAEACRREDLPWTCVVPEDRAWHPDNLSDALESWGKMKSQVIVTTTVGPSRVPKGWHMVQMKE